MAKGILIDVGFTSEGLKDYINDIEREFKSVNWSEKIGLSDALDKQIGDVKDKIAELKKELEALGKGHGIDANFKTQFEEMNKSIKVLQQSMKVLMESAPKNKQAGLANQLSQISQQIQNTADVAKNASQFINDLAETPIVNKQQLNEIQRLYVELEKARQAAENFDKTRKQIANKPYLDTDAVMNDLIAQYKLYSQLSAEQDKLAASRKKDKENLVIVNNAELLKSITNMHRLINTIQSLSETPLSNYKVNKLVDLESLNQKIESQYETLLQTVADKKAKLQAEFSTLGGKGELSSYFDKDVSKANERGITIPVFIAPGSKKKLITECSALIADINAKLTNTPIQVEVQLISAFQSKKNTALIQELQKNIISLQNEAKQKMAEGLSEGEVAQFTQISNDMEQLLIRLNKQIDNALIFTVEVNTTKAIDSIKAFIEEVKSKLPTVKPDVELSAAAKRSFKSQINSYIKDLNKEISKIEVQKGKLNDDIFTKYVKRLMLAVSELKKLQESLSGKDITKLSAQKGADDFEKIKDQITADIQAVYSELTKAFDPANNNLNVWARKLLSTLDSAANKISQLFSNNGGHNSLAEYLQDIAYSDKMKQRIEGNQSTLEHGGILLKNGKIVGLTSTDEHDSTRYSNPSKHTNYYNKDILSTIHTHSGDATWVPSLADLKNAIDRQVDYAITATTKEVATFNVKDFKSKYGQRFDFDKVFNNLSVTAEEKFSEIGKIYKQIIPTFIKNSGTELRYLRAASPINNSKASNEVWMQDAFLNAEELINKSHSFNNQEQFFLKLFENLGLNFQNDQNKFTRFTNNAFQLMKHPSGQYTSRAAYLNLAQKSFIDLLTKEGVDFNKYFKIQSHEEFEKNPAFGLGKVLNQNNGQINIADVTKNINQIVDNVNKLNQLDTEKKQANEQLLTDINNNLQSIVQELPNLSKAMGELSAKGIAVVSKTTSETPVISQETPIPPKEVSVPQSTTTQTASKETSKVAQQLGKYFGENYAQGILDEKKKVQNAIRALVEAGKLTKQDLTKDKLSESDYVYDKIVNGANPTTQAKHYQKMIDEFDTYQRVIQQSLKLQLPTDKTLKNDVIATHKKNLEELQTGAIDAQKAIYNLKEAYGDFSKGDSKVPLIKALQQIPKVEEKPVAQTQELINKFEELKGLIQNAFTQKDLMAAQQYFDEINKINEQLNSAHATGKKKRNNFVNTTQDSLDQLREELKKQPTKPSTTQTETTTTVKDVTKAVNDKTKAFDKEIQTVVPGLKEEISQLNKLKKTLKDIPQLVNDKTNAFVDEKKAVKNAVTSEISDLGKLSKAQAEEKKKKEQEANLNKAQKNLNKNYEQIQNRFTSMLQQDNRTLVESSFEPTKDGLIKIKALIKEADDSYKSFIYTTKTGKGKNPFTLVEAKEGFTIDKQAALYEKFKKAQEALNKEPQMIGNVRPNTEAWEQLLDLARDFGLEVQDIVKIIRNVDHGVESFQFFDKAGNRTTLGINSDYKLYERNPIFKMSEDVDNFKKKIADLPKIIRNGIVNYDANASSKYIDNLKQIAELWQRITEYRQLGNLPKEDFDSLKGLFGGSSETILDTISARLPSEKKTPEMVQNIGALRKEFQQLFNDISQGGYNIDDISIRLTDLLSNAKKLYQDINIDSNRLANATAVTKLLANIGDELNRNTRMSSVFREQLKALVKEIQDMGQAIPNDKFKDFTARFQNIRSQIHLAGQTGKGFFDQMGTSLGRSIIQFANMYLSLYRIVSYIRQGIGEVTKLDKALTTMSYTMNITNSQLKEMGSNIVAMAKDLKVSVDNVSQIYQIYANMQTTTEEMMKTARPTAILTNLSGVDASTAADQIQGVLNQFNMLADESMHIVDVYDYISANIPVDYSKGIAGMADAVKNVGNVAAEAGLSFEQLGAIIGKVMAKTRQDGASIGNALRTIMVRISKANKLAGDEVDNATVGNAAKALHKIGVEVYTTSGEFREFDTIMGELAERWDDLSDAEQANISFQIAATRQTALLKALLDQWTGSMKLATEATEANGNALANQEKYEASIAGRTQALQNEITEFWINTLNSDIIKNITSELTKFVGELNKANSSAGALVTTVGDLVNGLLKLANSMPSGSALGLLLGLTKGRNMFTSVNPNGGVNFNLGPIAKTFGTNMVTANDVKLFRDYTNLLKNETIPVSQAWNDTMANASIQAQQMATNAAVSGKSVNATMAAMRVQVMATRAAAVALNVALSIGLTVAITGVISLISKWAHAEENNRKKIRESINTLKERNETLKKQQKTIDDTIEKYKEYSKQLSDISTTEEERYEIRKDLYELQEDVIDQFGKTAEGLDLVNGKYDEQLKYLQNITEEQRKSYVVNSAGNYLSNKKAIESFYPAQISKMFMNELGTNAYVQFQNNLPNMSNYPTLSASETKKFWEDLIYKETIGETNYFSKELQDSVVTTWQNFINDENNLLSNAIDAERENAIYEQFVAEGSIYAEDYKAISSLIQELRGYITNNEFEKYDQRINDLLAYDLNSYKDAGEIVYSAFESLFKQFTIPTNLKNYQPNSNNLLQDYYTTQKNKYQNNITTLDNLIAKSFPNYYQGSEYYTQYGEELKSAVQNIMDKQGMTFEEVEQEIHFLGDSVIDFIKKYTPEELPKELSTFDKWLEESSSIYSDDKKQEKYTNNALIDAYKSSISGFKDFITNDEQGKIQINFGEIAKFVGSTDFFKQIGMESFENYVYGFGEDAKILEGLGEEEAKLYAKGFGENADALGAYIHDALNKVLHDIDSTQLTDTGLSLLTDLFHNINADIFGVSESTAKIEQSYWELRDVQKRVQEGEEFSKDEATYLMQKYDSLYGSLEERIKGVDETTGELITTYKIQESAIDSLVNEYGTMSNEAITSMKNQSIYAKDTIEWLRKMEYEILQAQIDLINFNTASKITAQGLMDAYNTRDARAIADALKGVTDPEDRAKLQELTSQIGRRLNELVQGYSYDLKIQDDDGTGKGKDSGDKDSKAQYDWLDSYLDKRNRALQKEETAYDRLTNKIIKKGDIESQYTQLQNQSLEEQNKLLDDQIAAYDKAEKEYGRRMKKGLLYNDLVEAFGGSKDKANEIVQKIINREDINLLEYTSEQSSAISAMADNYNKQLDAADKKLEAQNTKRENALKMFTNNIEFITKKFDHVLNEFAQRQSQLEHYQSMRTNSGMMENQKLYVALLDNESRELAANIAKRNELINTLNTMKPKTEAEIEKWWETKDAIDSTTQAIWESQEAIESYNASMQQLSWDLNDKIRDITGNIRNETAFLMDTLGTFERDMYSYERQFLGNDAEKTKIYNGQMSKQGLATLALRRVNAKSLREDVERINKEIEDAQELYLQNTANTRNLDRLNDLISERNSLIQSYKDEREAIVSLVKEGYDKQLESLQAITDKYMEARQAEKDLYDYQKNIAKQTKNIANLRKQMAAYAGDMSEEARAKMQTLTVQLEEAEEGLADTQYERQLSDQQRIFDHLYQSLEDYFNDKLENPEKIISDTKDLVNNNIPAIKQTLAESLKHYKTNISASLNNILGESGIGKVASNIAAVDGDIKAIKNSVTERGDDLKEYLKQNELTLAKKETIYERINALGLTQEATLSKRFDDFNTKLTEINNTIKSIDKTNTTPTSTSMTVDAFFELMKDEYNLGKKTRAQLVKLLNKGEFDDYIAKHNISLHYASGTKRVGADALAWTQERGFEAILRPTDNAILTPLKAGDSVLNAKATQTLWDFANNPLAFMRQNMGVTNVSRNSGVTFNNSMSPTIVVNGVSNANEFIRELQKNKQFESMIQDMTINQMNGGNPLAKMKYKF